MHPSLYPDASAASQRLAQLVSVFSESPAVHRILVFGSFAREQVDAWSDIDLLVVTHNRSQFGLLFTQLALAMPILYRSTFSPEVEPSGGRVLGIVFEGASLFHCLDLNFMTKDEFESVDALERFGVVKSLYVAAGGDTTDDIFTSMTDEVELPDEKQIAEGLHFTKKHLKRVLRGVDARTELARHAGYLRQFLREHPFSEPTPRGNIMAVAEAYLSMAEDVLGQMGNPPLP